MTPGAMCNCPGRCVTAMQAVLCAATAVIDAVAMLLVLLVLLQLNLYLQSRLKMHNTSTQQWHLLCLVLIPWLECTTCLLMSAWSLYFLNPACVVLYMDSLPEQSLLSLAVPLTAVSASNYTCIWFSRTVSFMPQAETVSKLVRITCEKRIGYMSCLAKLSIYVCTVLSWRSMCYSECADTLAVLQYMKLHNPLYGKDLTSVRWWLPWKHRPIRTCLSVWCTFFAFLLVKFALAL